jgi:ATP-binding cassette, subfamily A (ABC1), member 2
VLHLRQVSVRALVCHRLTSSVRFTLFVSFLQMIQHALPLCLTISWVYAFAMLTQSIVYEKEVRLKEVMKIMGLSNAVHWVAWFITIFSQTTLVMIAVTIILHYGQVLMHSNAFLIFIILEIYALATISLA